MPGTVMANLHKARDCVRRRPQHFLVAWCAFTLLLVLGGGSYVLLQERQQIFAKAGNTAQDYANTLTQRVEASIATADLLLDFIASDVERGANLKSDTTLATEFEKTLQKHPELMAVMVVLANGHPAEVTRPALSATMDFSDRDYFRYHQSHADTALHISTPITSRMSGQAVIPLTRRLNDRHGNFAGVAFVGLIPRYFEEEFKKLALGKNGSTAFTTRDGAVLFRYPHVAGAIGKDISRWNVFKEVVLRQPGGVGEMSCPVDGVVRLHAFRHATRFPIIAFAGIASDDLQAEWLASMKIKVPLLLTLLMLMAGSGFVICRQWQREGATKLRLKASLRRADSANHRAQELADTLQRATNFQGAVLNSTACGILATDSKGTITFMNASAEKILGYSPEALIGKMSPLDFHRAEDVREALDLADPDDTPYLSLVAYLNAHPGREWSFVRRDGSTVGVSLSTTALKNQEERIDGFVTIFNDLTELNRLEGLKSDFISVVSHELRTPVTAIRGALSLHQAALQGSLAPSQERLLGIATGNCDRLIKIVSDILDIDKLARNKLTLHCTSESVTTLIERAVAQTQPFANLHGVTYWIGAATEQLTVSVDADRLLQVLVNLLSNAAKFSHQLGEVVVSAEKADGLAVVRVTDFGIGIEEAFQPYVFERFSQHSSGLTRKTGGTGLGLAISKMLVEAHGGTISFQSEQGKGTTFSVSIPLVRDRVVA